jgi:peptide/nickel transport system substrate-binding protein
MVFTAKVSADRSLPMRQHFGFAVVESVEALDSRTVLTRWKEPFIEADWMFSYTFGLPLPRHLLGRAYEEAPESFAELPYWNSEFVGTGPFRLREFVRSERLVLEANDAYVLGRPKVDVVEIRFLANENARITHMLAGEVEITFGGIEAQQVAQLSHQWTGGRVLAGPTTSSNMIFPQYIDPNPAIQTNVDFRRALLHAIDRQAIIDTLLDGLPTLAEVSVVNPAGPEYVEIAPLVRRYEYDPRKSAQMIEQLGYARGAGGAFADPAGQPLSLEIRGTEGQNGQMALTISDYWQRVGITAQPVVISRQRANDREYRVSRPAFEFSNASSELKGLEALHTRALPVPENDWAGTNRARYSNAELDTLLNRYFVTIPYAERTAVLGQIARHVSDRLVTLGLFYGVDTTAASHRVRNVWPGEPRNSIEWDLAD